MSAIKDHIIDVHKMDHISMSTTNLRTHTIFVFNFRLLLSIFKVKEKKEKYGFYQDKGFSIEWYSEFNWGTIFDPMSSMVDHVSGPSADPSCPVTMHFIHLFTYKKWCLNVHSIYLHPANSFSIYYLLTKYAVKNSTKKTILILGNLFCGVHVQHRFEVWYLRSRRFSWKYKKN